MSEASETRVSIEVGIDRLTKLRVFITDRRVHYLAQSAYNTMQYGVKTYWNKHYNLSAGLTSQLALFQGGGDLTLDWAKRRYKGMKVLEPSTDSVKFRSRKGNKRLIAFTFGKPTDTGDFQASNLSIHSFPMNWYERDVMLGGWADGTIRKGTHIIKKLLPPKAQSELSATAIPLKRDIEQRWKEMQ